MVGIYKISSPSGKVYIGQSWNIKYRFSQYKGSVPNQRLLNRSLKKYGFENHLFQIIHELPYDVEQFIMDSYELLYWEFYRDAGFSMLNLREPGNSRRHSEETKLLIGNSNRGKKPPPVSEKRRNELSVSMKGNNFRKGRKNSKEHNKAISNGVKTKVYTDQVRLNLSNSKKGCLNPMFGKPSWNNGLKLGIEGRKKLSNLKMGKPHSEKHKQLISEALNKSWEKRRLKNV